MVTWDGVVKRYGKRIAKKMEKCPYTQAITVRIRPDGKMDIHECDIEVAWKWATGKPVYVEEVD